MVQVLLTRFPEKTNEFILYQRTIIIAVRDYDEEAWVSYDSCFRRQAAAHKALNWSQIDFTLYNQAFASWAKVKNQCRHCLSEFHRSAKCEYAPEKPPPPKCPPAPAQHQGRWDSQHWESKNQQSAEACLIFNDQGRNKCRYKPCRYQHVCNLCWGLHPAPRFPKKQHLGQERARTQPLTGQDAGRRTR